tara:strand:- start:2753 stop:4630 length:1878 start_codon:yes stop_codon:yes gene_type:complete
MRKLHHKDILIVMYDKTQSVIETKKIDQLIKVKKNIKDIIVDEEKLEIVEIEVNNLNNKDGKIQTKIITNVQKAFQKLEKNRVAGVIIVTDGIIHDLDKIEEDFIDIPIHFFLLGNKNERDRSIITENIPEYAVVGKPIDFMFKIIDENFQEEVSASFILDGMQILTKTFITNINHQIKLPINHAGENLLEIKINNHPNEITFANNYKVFKINGIHEKLRVMLISGEPNMGLRNWRNILNSDPSIELLHFTILRPPSKRDLTPVKELALIPFPSQELFSADISKFSLIILDQYTLQGILPKKYLDNIVDYVIGGGAILNISGQEYLSDRSLLNSSLVNILPTRPEEFFIGPFLPSLTELGKRHPITNTLEKAFKENKWGKWFSFIKANKISGQTLMSANKYPLLIINEVSQGRVAQILSDQSWVWNKDRENKGPLVELLRNTIHWLLKTPELQENYLNVIKNNNFITLNLNSLNEGDTSAIITSPSGENLFVLMKDNKNGSLFGKFESTEYGKFNIKVNDIEKDFFIGITDSKELEKVSSSSFLINSFFEKNKQYLYSITWLGDSIPKIVKVFNKNNIAGSNWVGLLEKKVQKNDTFINKELINWSLIMPLLLLLLFMCWYRENR